LQDIAGRNALALRIAPDLAAIALPALHQSRESDTAFLRRLGRENDAVATIKTGTLIFARKGAGTTSTGQPLPTLALTRRSGDGHSWQRQTRDGQAGVTAHWHDRKAARHRAVTMGKAEGAKTLRKTYPDEASARRAATAEHTRLKRAPPPSTCASPGPPRRHPRSPRHPHRLQTRNRRHPMADHRSNPPPRQHGRLHHRVEDGNGRVRRIYVTLGACYATIRNCILLTMQIFKRHADIIHHSCHHQYTAQYS
jgi:hypothetical protein